MSLRAISGLFVLGLSASMVTTGSAHAADGDGDPYAKQGMLLELGLYGGVFLASGRHELYEAPDVAHQKLNSAALDLGLRAGYFPLHFLGFELEGGLIPTGTRGGQSALGYNIRGHLVGQWQGRLTPFAVIGLGSLGISSDPDAVGDDADTEFHWGLGAKYAITPKWTVRFDGRHIVAPGVQTTTSNSATSHWELLAGLTFVIGRKAVEAPDPDGDGIRGAKDKCPNKPARTLDGCPPKDTDEDGVINDDDECPSEPGNAPSGCPDTDGDGVLDRDDKCPKKAGPNKGCPAPIDDADGDGVADADDKCPNQAGSDNGCPDLDPDKDGIITEDQCPNEAGVAPHGCPDSDSDGIPDKNDECKAEPETKNGFKDADGCPDELPKAVKKFTGAIKGINFASGSSKITKSSYEVLDQAVKLLKEYPDVRLEIGGYTDNVGRAATNTKLSQKRAESVKKYFNDNGIDLLRLEAKGYGPENPVASNKTRTGRAQNRRIEFKLLMK